MKFLEMLTNEKKQLIFISVGIIFKVVEVYSLLEDTWVQGYPKL